MAALNADRYTREQRTDTRASPRRRSRFADSAAKGRAMQPNSDSPDQQGPDLRIAPEPAETEVYAAIAAHLEARTLIVANPENHLVAALLNTSAAAASAVLALVEDTDIEGYLPATVVRLIRQLIDAGREPTPQAVIARARGPIDTSDMGTDSLRPSLARLAVYIIEVYTMAMPVRPWPDACTVVEDSFRRSFEQSGQRMVQMAQAWADIEDLEALDNEAVRARKAHLHRLSILSELAKRTR